MSNHRFDVPSLDGSEILTLELRAGEDTAHVVARRSKHSPERLAEVKAAADVGVVIVQPDESLCCERAVGGVCHEHRQQMAAWYSKQIAEKMEKTFKNTKKKKNYVEHAQEIVEAIQKAERDLKPDLGRPTGKVQTYSGVLYNVVEPNPKDIRLEDIAHHLANQCRYSGAVRRHYSVAEHSIWVSLLVPPELAKVALLHDAAEAYLVDFPRPLKHLPEMSFYRELEARNERAVGQRFGFFGMPDLVHRADVEALAMECRQLMPWEHAREWWLDLPTREPSAAAKAAKYVFEDPRDERDMERLTGLACFEPGSSGAEKAFLRRAAELGIS